MMNFKKLKINNETSPLLTSPSMESKTTSQTDENLSLNESPPPSSQPDTPPTHFDSLIHDTSQDKIDTAIGESGSIKIGKEEFYKMFLFCFTAGHNVTKLNSLIVKESDGGALNCSNALYETIDEIPALHFILNPSGKWGARIISIVLFALPMAQNVRAEIAARQKQPDSKPQNNEAVPIDFPKYSGL